MAFIPDYHHLLDVLANRRPSRLPVYEHLISPGIMEKILGVSFAPLISGKTTDLKEFFTQYCRFFREMTYDTVSYEVCIVEIIPDSGAILGGRPGPIQNRADFEKFPWADLPRRFWEHATPKFDMLAQCVPPGMKAVGGIGNGVFEISEDLVGYEYLSYLMVDDPELFANIFRKIGDLMSEIWQEFLRRYTDTFVVARFGDDLGFKTSTLVAPVTIREHILPQYKRVIDAVRQAGIPFLWHSCGNIFEIMDDVIALGINAKHSNEDAISTYETWISRYSDRIGLLGGIDLDILCVEKPESVYEKVLERGRRYRQLANGYALGSGNSIPDYTPVEGYLAMIRAAQRIRELEK